MVTRSNSASWFSVESALAFRASEIMMRSNAPIPALLALAALFLVSVSGLAKPTRYRVLKAAAVPSSRHRGSSEPVARAARTTHAGRRHGSAAPSIERVASTRTTRARSHQARELRTHQPLSSHDRRRLSRLAASDTVRTSRRSNRSNRFTAPELARTRAHGKATSSDFLKAANEALAVQPATAIHGTLEHSERPDSSESSQPADPSQAPVSQARRTSSPAAPVAVVSVIRPAAERPQLNSVEEAASTPVILPALYNKRGRLIMPPALKGSHEILLRQNQVADRDGLHRIQSDDDLIDMRNQGLLVPIPANASLDVDERLPGNRRFCRPWTSQFLSTLSRAHYARFHTALQVNSAVRTAEFQQHLIRINGNAAPAEGDTASPHLTGQAIDIAKRGLSLTEIAWMRGYLLPLVQAGKVDVEEEFQQSCFHISVYKRYTPASSLPERNLASAHRSETSTLAAAMR